jgi:uncharacterized protein YjbI with pentapeptide repeats
MHQIQKSINLIRYRHLSKLQFFLWVISKILVIHLSVYAISLARYEFAIFSLDSKIANVTTLYTGSKPKLALERIPRLQIKLPTKPIIHNVITNIKTLFPYFDDYEYEAYKEMTYLIIDHKHNLIDLNLNGLVFLGSPWFLNASDNFTYSNFKRVKLFNATLSFNNFIDSNFDNVDFFGAKMDNANFAFSTFYKCRLDYTNLGSSNLCRAKFINTIINTVNLKNSNLVGVDLSDSILAYPEHFKDDFLENLQGAFYNSKKITLSDDAQYKFVLETKCDDLNHVPSTKFPTWFDPEKYGMIDVSKW